MADLFTRTEVDFGGGMTSQFGMVTPKNGLTGVLMQNLSLSYQQQVTRLYELGKQGFKTKVYYVGGRAMGNVSAAHVIGPGVSMRLFYDNFGDVCNAQNNELDLKLTPNICANPGERALPGLIGAAAAQGVNAVASAQYICKFCVLTSIGLSVSAQDFVVNESSQMMFSGLQFNG